MKKENKEKNNRTIKLCGGGSCCPTVTFEANEVVLKDDFGGMVRLNKAEFAQLKEIARREEV